MQLLLTVPVNTPKATMQRKSARLQDQWLVAINGADRQIPDAISLHDRRMDGPGILLLNACAAVIFMLPLFAFRSHVHATAVLHRSLALARPAALINAATVALLLVSAFPLLLISVRLHVRRIENRFADSICVQELLDLLLDLHRDDALLNPDHHKLILYRIDYISRTALLIATRYGSNSHNSQAWTRQHCRRMSLHLHERARWVAAPTDDSLTALRRDFPTLLWIFATGRYGNVDWQGNEADDEALRVSPKQSRIERLSRVCGLSLPLVAMGLYLSAVGTHLLGPNRPVDKSINAYAFIAWMLLAID